jgi:hypothetical protein
MEIYKIKEPELIEAYFSGLPKGERPWEVWANDPLNSFSGGLKDLTLFIKIKIEDGFAGWALSDTGLEGNQPFTPDDREEVVDFLENYNILWNPEYALDYPEP